MRSAIWWIFWCGRQIVDGHICIYVLYVYFFRICFVHLYLHPVQFSGLSGMAIKWLLWWWPVMAWY